jgi:hypothetical protein
VFAHATSLLQLVQLRAVFCLVDALNSDLKVDQNPHDPGSDTPFDATTRLSAPLPELLSGGTITAPAVHQSAVMLAAHDRTANTVQRVLCHCPA